MLLARNEESEKKKENNENIEREREKTFDRQEVMIVRARDAPPECGYHCLT